MKTQDSVNVLLGCLMMPFLLSAQSVAPGSRVRISVPELGLQRAVGTAQDTVDGVLLVHASEPVKLLRGDRTSIYENATLVIDRDSGTMISVERAGETLLLMQLPAPIELELSDGTRKKLLDGLVVVLGGAVIGESTKSDSFGPSAGGVIAGLTVVTGLIYGLTSEREAWKPVPLPSSPTASVQIRPTFTNGVGFNASIPVGSAR